MKTSTLIIGFALFLTALTAQAKRLQPIEFELKFGAAEALDSYYGGHRTAGGVFGVELRYNFPNGRWDIGTEMADVNPTYTFKVKGETLEQENESFNLMFYGDYNFRPGKKVSPFVGAGLGVSSCMVSDGFEPGYYGDDDTVMCFTSRAGVEFFHTLRATTFLQLNRKGFNALGLTVGVVFGGRPK